MDPLRRKELTRFGAPAAFLAAVTIAVLLIKSALGGGGSAKTTTASALPRAPQTTTTRDRPVKAAPKTFAHYYTIQSGDTLGGVAGRLHTTVGRLLRLNPGIDPRALHAGQRIRVD